VFDNNTFVVEVIALVGTGAAIGSTHSVTISVDYGMNGVDNSSAMWFNVGPPLSGVFQVIF
jgi:hypothetical protein